MNNHPRFSCKHVLKHQKPNERHRCTLRAPFLCSKAQINGGEGDTAEIFERTSLLDLSQAVDFGLHKPLEIATVPDADSKVKVLNGADQVSTSICVIESLHASVRRCGVWILHSAAVSGSHIDFAMACSQNSTEAYTSRFALGPGLESERLLGVGLVLAPF